MVKGDRSVPKWANWGLGAVIAAYLLGMIPGISSPIDKINDSLKALAAIMVGHDQTMTDQSKTMTRTFKLICQGVWKGNADMQRECER